MAENYSSIISSNAFDFENNNAQKTNIFTAKNITRPIDQLPSSGGQPIEVIPPRGIDEIPEGGGQPIEVIPPGGIDEIPEGGGQPIKVTPPPEVNQALYEITFNRKLYGANLDVVNTLEDIEFKQGFSGIKTPTLNIAYLTHWRRGNAPTAGEKISTENTDIKNTEFKTDKSTQTFEILENSTFKSSALIDYKGVQTGIGEGRITLNNSNIKSFLNEFPVWEVRAPDAIERNETIQPSDLRILDSVSINGFEEEEEFIFSDGYYSFDENSTVLFEQFKPETRPSKQDLISKAKQQLEIERAKDSPSAETIKYLEDKIKQLQSIDDSQFVQETNLPPDPRQEAPTEPAPIGGEVRKADVSWTTPSISTQNQTEKVEGIWQFLFNPQTLERSFGPEFKYASSWGVPDGQAAHYSGHKNEELRFRDIILNGFVFGKRVESLVKGLEELTYVERDSGQQSPPVLEFVWGKKVFGPCVMEDISVAEQKWDGGELVDATLSFTLKKIPEWVVNDEYINIFDPSGQPLQQIIVPDPASSTTETDTAGGTGTEGVAGDGELTKSQEEANKKSPQCVGFNAYVNRIKKIVDAFNSAIINLSVPRTTEEDLLKCYSILDSRFKNFIFINSQGNKNFNPNSPLYQFKLFHDQSKSESKNNIYTKNSSILKNQRSRIDRAYSGFEQKASRLNSSTNSSVRAGCGAGNKRTLGFILDLSSEIISIMNNYLKTLRSISIDYECGDFKVGGVPEQRQIETITTDAQRTINEVCNEKLGTLVGKSRAAEDPQQGLKILYRELSIILRRNLTGLEPAIKAKDLNVIIEKLENLIKNYEFRINNKQILKCNGIATQGLLTLSENTTSPFNKKCVYLSCLGASRKELEQNACKLTVIPKNNSYNGIIDQIQTLVKCPKFGYGSPEDEQNPATKKSTSITSRRGGRSLRIGN